MTSFSEDKPRKSKHAKNFISRFSAPEPHDAHHPDAERRQLEKATAKFLLLLRVQAGRRGRARPPTATADRN